MSNPKSQQQQKVQSQSQQQAIQKFEDLDASVNPEQSIDTPSFILPFSLEKYAIVPLACLLVIIFYMFYYFYKTVRRLVSELELINKSNETVKEQLTMLEVEHSDMKDFLTAKISRSSKKDRREPVVEEQVPEEQVFQEPDMQQSEDMGEIIIN
jgi:predicted membrane protein